MEKYIVFISNEERFAIDISKVERIIEFTDPKKIPEASDYLLGVTQYNSKVMPIIDLSMRLYNVHSQRNLDTKVIVILWKDGQLGFVVDDILGIRHFVKEEYERIEDDTHILKKYIKGFIKAEDDITIVLDIDRIFDSEQEEELILATDSEQ
ncbi:MAG: chemotaxis protein CheW [Tissierellaceae bacterium]